jgi:hypothetical protein
MSFYGGDTLHAGAIVPAEATANLQWQFAPHSIGPWSDIGGETGSTYVVQESDVGGYIRVKATGSGFWRGTVYSNDTGEILSGYGFTIEITLAGADTFTLPLVQKYNTNQYCAYNCTVDWGDGSENSVITAYNDADRTHSYAGAGTYQIKITGTMDGWSFNNAGDKLLITKVVHWGTPGVFGGFKFIAGGFYGCSNLTSLGVGKILASTTGANDGVELDGFWNTFSGCAALTAIPSGLFDNHTSVSRFAFRSIFYGCNKITVIPSGLFDYNTAVSTEGFYNTFYGCTGLTSLPVDLFRYNTAVSSYGFYNTFYGCTGLTSLPVDLFRYNTAVSSYGFGGTFNGCTGLTSLPVDLFRYNTAVSSYGFEDTFRGCTGLTSLPTDIFRYNTAVSTIGFGGTFNGCTGLTSLPVDLFRYNTAVSSYGFRYTFYGCTKLQLRADIFYAAGEQSTRFLNKSISFPNCFDRSSFSGTQGTAPDLWNCDFGTGTVTKTDCFNGAGNSATSLSNYADIPAAWL